MADPGQWLGPRSMAVSVTPSPSGSDTPIVGSSRVPWTTSGVAARASAGASSGTGSGSVAGAAAGAMVVVVGAAAVDGTGWSTNAGRGAARPSSGRSAQPVRPTAAASRTATAESEARRTAVVTGAPFGRPGDDIATSWRESRCVPGPRSARSRPGCTTGERTGRRRPGAPDAGRDADAAGPRAGQCQAGGAGRHRRLGCGDCVEVPGPGLGEGAGPAADPDFGGRRLDAHGRRQVVED